MIRLFKEKVDPYDEKFGEPTTEVVDIESFVKFLDDVIRDAENNNYIEEDINDNYNFEVDRIVATNYFEKAIKLLHKKKKTDVLKEIKDVVIRLGNYDVGKSKDNHPLKNAEGHMDIHIEGGNLILVYKYFSEEVFELNITQESLNRILRLQDVVNHKELKNYDKKKYKSDAHDYDIDNIDK